MKGMIKGIGLLVIALTVLFGTNLYAGEEIRGKVVDYNPSEGSIVLRLGVHGIAGQSERDLGFDVRNARWTVCLGGSCAELGGKEAFKELDFYRTFGPYGMESDGWTAILEKEGSKVVAVRINLR